LSLKLYSEPNEDAQFDATSPFTVTFDGRVGGKVDRLVYVRNDDILRYYTNIQAAAWTLSGEDMTDDSVAGFYWKMMVKDIRPTNEEWGQVSSGTAVSLGADIGSSGDGDIITFLPLWVRVSIPRAQRIQTVTSVVIRLTATENVV
jgi:hypothetical protein